LLKIVVTLTDTLTPSDTISTQFVSAGSDIDARPISVRVISGTYNNGNDFQDFSITPSLVSVDKAFAICSIRAVQGNDHEGIFKAWEITSTSNLRIHASDAGSAPDTSFVCNIVEFSNDTPCPM